MENLAHFYRFLWEEPNLLVITGNAANIMKGLEAYNAQYRIEMPSKENLAQLRRLFSATGLAAVSLADRESWGWSLTLPGQDLGYFCGIEPEGLMSTVVRQADPEQATVALQRKKPSEKIKQSYYEPQDDDLVKTIERCFEVVDQIKTRIAVAKDGRAVLVQALPDSKFHKVDKETMGDEELVDLIYKMVDDESLKSLEEVLLFYECRCDDERILEMLTSLDSKQREELWGNEDKLQIECPRCGREYTVNRRPLQA